MSQEAREWAWGQTVPGIAKLVLLALAEHARPDGQTRISINAIARECELSRSTVIRELNVLREREIISLARTKNEDGSQGINHYWLHLSATS